MSNPNMPTKTGWLIILLSLIMLVWEVYVILSGKGTTLSEEIWNMNDRTVIVSFSFGLLAGHFFWPRRK